MSTLRNLTKIAMEERRKADEACVEPPVFRMRRDIFERIDERLSRESDLYLWSNYAEPPFPMISGEFRILGVRFVAA